MKDDKKTLSVLALVFIAGLAVILATSDTGADITQVAEMTEATHGENAEPNYDVVFPDDRVNEITIRIAPEDWGRLLQNITDNIGPFGTDIDVKLPKLVPIISGQLPN